MQQRAYFFGTSDHPEHSSNPEYWDILLGPLAQQPERFRDGVAADFGSGRGRNIENLLGFSLFKKVYGVDLSPMNVLHTRRRFGSQNVKAFVGSGSDVRRLPTGSIDFFMSAITLQHIAPHEIRNNILKDIFRALAPGGLLSFQVAAGIPRGPKAEQFVPWLSNHYKVAGTNGKADCVVKDSADLVRDLSQLGYVDVEVREGQAWSNPSQEKWLYCLASKGR